MTAIGSGAATASTKSTSPSPSASRSSTIWRAIRSTSAWIFLSAAGVKRVYTPKDFDLTRIMREIVEVVQEGAAAA